MLIPTIVISSVSKNTATEALALSELEATSALAHQQSDVIGNYFSDQLDEADMVVSDEAVKLYLGGDESLSEAAAEKIRTLKSYSYGVIKAMLVSSEGEILQSTTSDDIGKLLTNHSSYMTLAASGTGFSPIYIHTDLNGNQEPAYVLVTNIYSEDNTVIGILYEQFYTDFLEDMISQSQVNQYTTVAIADSEKNLLIPPYSTISQYGSHPTFAAWSGAVESAITDAKLSEGGANSTAAIEKKGNKSMAVFAQVIPDSDWVFLTMTNYGALLENVTIRTSHTALDIILIILFTGLIATAAIYLLLPLNNLVNVLSKKLTGDTITRVAFNDRDDEFDFLRDQLNDLFDKLSESNLRYDTMVEMTNNIVFSIDLKRHTVETSKNFNKKFAFRPKDNSLEESFVYKMRVHKDDKEKYFADIDAILKEANFIDGEYRIRNLYDDFAWVMLKATKFFDRNENPSKIIGVIVDIDREKKSKMRLMLRASYDSLTQILNRETFIKQVSETLDQTAYRKELAAILFIDLDDFKHYNDTYDHDGGDEVLKFTADSLKEITFERGFAGRFGGDEFVACLTGLTLYQDAGNMAQELIDTMGKGFFCNKAGMVIEVHCSVGIAFLHESGKTAEDVIAAADAAMYNIKKHGKSAYAYAQKGDEKPSELSPKPIDTKAV
ncbi:MAG: diguanylate cyclase [Ruminococcus sp.]|nr:diguanylate cyclase [Ruminococcus sp.]